MAMAMALRMTRRHLSITSFPLLLLLFVTILRSAEASKEGEALIAFKRALVDPFGVLQSWDSELENPCTWFRITCNSDNFVTRIDLGEASLSGTLVPELGALVHLQYLEVFNNSLSGSIPQELGDCQSLVSLDLYNNLLTGPIPAALGILKQLKFLRLNNNRLSGDFPASLAVLPELQVLDVSNNHLSGEPCDGPLGKIPGACKFSKN